MWELIGLLLLPRNNKIKKPCNWRRVSRILFFFFNRSRPSCAYFYVSMLSLHQSTCACDPKDAIYLICSPFMGHLAFGLLSRLLGSFVLGFLALAPLQSGASKRRFRFRF